MKMKKLRLCKALLVFLFILLPVAVLAQITGPIVSVDNLEKNLTNPKVVVLDVRKVEEYKAGHIPGAVNVFYGTWAIKRGDLLNELPSKDDLADVISSAGIAADSTVVVVGKMDAPGDRVDATRVAWTLKYMGVANVVLLSGGYNKWVSDKKPVFTDMVKAKPKSFNGRVNSMLIVTKDYVMSRLGTATIVDVREADVYRGEKKLPFVAKLGRIKGAVNLPTSLIYQADGTYKDSAELAAIASKVVGTDKDKEIITYCDTGKFCTAWSLILSDLLGYKDVKIYDGSSQEWMADPAAPVEP
jgi:thiosulfate/3-mercaptopyruvate sulfurtransferase